MTHEEALKLALAEFENQREGLEEVGITDHSLNDLIAAIKEALQSNEQVEPVAWKPEDYGYPKMYEPLKSNDPIRSEIREVGFNFAHPPVPTAQPKQEPISDVTEAVTKTVIQVEKLLCEKLGKTWRPSGMSISTLIDELAQPKEPEQEQKMTFQQAAQLINEMKAQPEQEPDHDKK